MENRQHKTCPLRNRCGGCQFQGVTYTKQLESKQANVQELLGAFGRVEPIIGMKKPKYYRNKVHHAFTKDRNGNVISGPYEANSHWILKIDDCMIEDRLSQDIIHTIEKLVRSFHIKTYDEDTGYGVFRHVLIRRGFTSGEVMVVLVLGNPILPSKNNFVKALREAHPEITTVVLNVNDKRTSMVLGEKEKVLYGPGFIKDKLCGLTFRISAKSFYQVNPVQTEVLYRTAIDFAELKGTETVVDAYCGIGTIGLSAAAHCKNVIGVELNGDAVKDAILNAKENKINNVRFYKADATEFLKKMAEDGEKADVILMDPPRSGSTETFMDSAVRMKPKKIVYVSCNPETLARDLEYITRRGYAVKKIQPVDMFPFTDHVESVVLLTRA